MKNGLQDESIHNIQVISSLDTATINEKNTLDVNIKSGSNQILLCNDYENDIVYYINYGRDYFIYRIKDGKSELVVEMPAKSIFHKRGKLYFILEFL